MRTNRSPRTLSLFKDELKRRLSYGSACTSQLCGELTGRAFDWSHVVAAFPDVPRLMGLIDSDQVSQQQRHVAVEALVESCNEERGWREGEANDDLRRTTYRMLQRKGELLDNACFLLLDRSTERLAREDWDDFMNDWASLASGGHAELVNSWKRDAPKDRIGRIGAIVQACSDRTERQADAVENQEDLRWETMKRLAFVPGFLSSVCTRLSGQWEWKEIVGLFSRNSHMYRYVKDLNSYSEIGRKAVRDGISQSCIQWAEKHRV